MFKITPIVQSDVRNMKEYFIKEGIRCYTEQGTKGLRIYKLFIFEHQRFVNDVQDKQDIINSILNSLCNDTK